MELQRILELSELARKQGASITQQRELLKTIHTHRDKTYLGLCGPRGAGKTSLLKQLLAQSENALYISVDTLPHDTNLFDLIQALHQNYQTTTFLLDEVHFNKEIDQHLKSCFDFLSIRIIFTSSVSLKMFKSAYDLARRVTLLKVPYFSFREYLAFYNHRDLPRLSFREIIEDKIPTEHRLQEIHFENYLQGGLLPFALEVKKWQEPLHNTLMRIINDDIPRVQDITLQETQTIYKSVQFIGRSAIDGINPSSLSKNLGITRYKAEQYLQLLEQAFVVQLLNAKGTNVLREPKVVLTPPYRLLFQGFEEAKGELREDFAVEALSRIGTTLFYIKNQRGKKTPDFLIENEDQKFILEVGGTSKNKAQLRGIKGDERKIIFKDGPPYDHESRPLSSLGFLF